MLEQQSAPITPAYMYNLWVLHEHHYKIAHCLTITSLVEYSSYFSHQILNLGTNTLLVLHTISAK